MPHCFVPRAFITVAPFTVGVAVASLIAVHGTGRTSGHMALHERGEGRVARAMGAAAAQPALIDVRMTPIADTTIERNRPSVSLGDERTLDLGRQLAPGDNARSILLRFGLVDVEPGSLVVTATLSMTRLEGLGAASVGAGLGSISEPFDERTATWSNRPDIARNGSAVYVESAPGVQRFDVAWAVEEALRAQRNIGLQFEVPAGGCEGGRGRTFVSRENDQGAPELRLAYVGPGTPHPFPSPTPSNVPTWTATPTGTRPPTPTPTSTSDRPQPRPPVVTEPQSGAVLPPPEGVDAWVVRWRQFAPTLCSYRIVLDGPAGPVYSTDIPNTRATCHPVTTESPGMPPELAEGKYSWRIRSACPPFEPQEAQSPPFELRATPSPLPSPSGVASSTAVATAQATEAATATARASATVPATPTDARGTSTATATATATSASTATPPPRMPAYLPFAARRTE